MAWNEPGGSNNDKDPWGNRNKDQGPPDLDEIFANFRKKFGGIFGSGKGGSNDQQGGLGGIIAIIVLVILVWLVYSSTYILNERQNGVVLRFGKYVATLQSGFNVRFPYPIETVDIVNVQAVRAFNVGQGSSEALMLTKDKNIVDIEFVVQYQVGDAKKFVLNTRNPLISLEYATQTAVREMVGQSDMEYLQTQGRSAFALRSKERIQEILDRYQTGLIISSFEMQKAQAPREVIPAYEEVNAAEQEKEAEINKAEAFANTILPKAEGNANRMLEQAEQYKVTLVKRANGDAQRFTQLLKQYEKAPKVTRERLYLETMQDIIGNSKKVIVDVDKGNSLLYLPLDQIVSPQMIKNRSGNNNSNTNGDFNMSNDIPSESSNRSRSRVER